MTKLKNFLKLLIPYLIAILSFIGGKYQFNNAIEILILFLVIALLASYPTLIFEVRNKICYLMNFMKNQNLRIGGGVTERKQYGNYKTNSEQ